MTRGPAPRLRPSAATPADGPVRQRLTARSSQVGDIVVRRALPHRDRRRVGPWVFLDHFGPTGQGGGGMNVGPHPHIGLQTVTWLFSGHVVHQDSVGSHQAIEPGQLNLMTAGRGIVHVEHSDAGADQPLHGVQLWVALPQDAAATAPGFDHYDDLPRARVGAADVTVFMGAMAGLRSPARTFSPLVGLEVRVRRGGGACLPVDPTHELAVLVCQGRAEVAGAELAPGTLLYMGLGRNELNVRSNEGAILVVVGGPPVPDELLLWWNFVGRSWEEIVDAREDWADASPRFPDVPDYGGDRIEAPALPG